MLHIESYTDDSPNAEAQLNKTDAGPTVCGQMDAARELADRGRGA